MPLAASQDPANPATLGDGIQEQFLIFYASRDEEGKLWCPVRAQFESRLFVRSRSDNTLQDCVAVDKLIQGTFGPADAPSALIVHVGQRAEWVMSTSTLFGAKSS